jgi:hypothetical protein
MGWWECSYQRRKLAAKGHFLVLWECMVCDFGLCGGAPLCHPSSATPIFSPTPPPPPPPPPLFALPLQRAVWDETVKGHVLNFRGRVTVSSVKNFQLSCEVCVALKLMLLLLMLPAAAVAPVSAHSAALDPSR